MKIAKYEFNSKEQFKTKEIALGLTTDEDGNEYPTHNHSIVELGHIVLEAAVYDEDGNEVTPAVFSTKYHVDVMYRGVDSHPWGWATYAVELTNEGSHSFFGVNYLDNRL